MHPSHLRGTEKVASYAGGIFWATAAEGREEKYV